MKKRARLRHSSSSNDDDFSPRLVEEDAVSEEADERTFGRSTRERKVWRRLPKRANVVLGLEFRECVLRLHAYFRDQKLGDPASRVAEALDVGVATVKNLCAEFQASGVVTDSSRGNSTNHVVQLDKQRRLMQSVRTLLLERAANDSPTSMKFVFNEFKARGLLGNDVKYRTWTSWLRRKGFRLTSQLRKGNRSLQEQTRILGLASAFLRVTRENRFGPKPRDQVEYVEVWGDESYCHVSHTRSNSLALPSDNNTLRSLHQRKGPRYCFSSFITKDGILPDSTWIFQPDKSQAKKADYHASFNSVNYTTHFVDIMGKFEACYPGRKAMFIMDNARYHAFYRDGPKAGSKKADVQAYLLRENVAFDPSANRFELLAKALDHNRSGGFHLQRLAADRGHRLLFTPPRYSEWQPIELLWAAVKNHVASKTPRRTMADLLEQLKEGFMKFGTAAQCSKFIHHAFEEMDRYDQLITAAENARESAAVAANDANDPDGDELSENVDEDTNSDSARESESESDEE